MMGSGEIIICMDRGFILGGMAGSMRDNIIMIRNMGLGFTDGLMGGFTRGIGRMVSNMAEVGMFCRMEQLRLESGPVESERDGSKMTRLPSMKDNKYD